LSTERTKHLPLFELSKELLEQAIRSSPESLLIKDRNGTIVIGSPSIAEFIGCDFEDLPGLNTYELLPSKIAEAVQKRDRITLESGESETSQETWDLGHESRTVLVSRSPVRDKDGEIVGVMSGYRNISHLHQAYAFFEQDQKRFITLAQTCPVGIFECNPFHQITYVNPEWERITGLTLTSVYGRSWMDFVAADQISHVKEIIGTDDDAFGIHRADCLFKGRFSRWVELSLNHIPHTDGSIVSYIGSIVDLTERRQTQQQLLEHNETLERRVDDRTQELKLANESLLQEIDIRRQTEEELESKRLEIAHVSRISIMGRISGELAHELSQPLNAIQNYVGSLSKLLSNVPNNESANRILNLLNDEITRSAKIIRRTRDFVSTGRHRPEVLDLVELVANTAAMLKGEARRRKMSIQTSLPTGLQNDGKLPFKGDTVRLQQVLVNLVLNALESMVDCQGSDKIAQVVVSNDRQIQIDIHDTGNGVKESSQLKLFDPFFTTKSNGLGMGLAISRDIIKMHGGSLTYHARLPQGSTFRIILPNDVV
jgi:PAS domain S-box-containing protein